MATPGRAARDERPQPPSPAPAGAAPSGPAWSMGLRKETGCRRCPVCEYAGVVFPRCGPASPFKGHLSTKSNAFCIDCCRNLSNQYLIRDHMVIHYNRILSAKAAVDTSMPKSRLTSIKLADQQRREKLKKKISKCEEKLRMCEAASQCCARDSRRLLPSCFRKTFTEADDNHCPCFGPAKCLLKRASPCGGYCLVHSCPLKCPRRCTRKTSYSNSSICLPRPANKHCGFSHSHSTESLLSIGCSQRCHGNHSRLCSGDLLDRHSECFTKSRKPFTPRTLISDAKPFLSDYRFYTPARRKKKSHRKQCVEAQTQTEVISFSSAEEECVRKIMDEQRKSASKAEDKKHALDERERVMDGFQSSVLREKSCCSQKSSPKRTVDAEEEELLYLTFIEDVTNEILRLGLFSNRVLDQLFECYIEENKNRLDEGKMRQMLAVLKSDLGCGQDREPELIKPHQEASEPMDLRELATPEEHECTSKGHRMKKATKSEEFVGTVGPNKCESLTWSERSRETQISQGEDSSEDATEYMDAGTESDLCGVEFEELPGTSPSCEAALNLNACDSVMEVKKELEDLQENLARTLHISHNY